MTQDFPKILVVAKDARVHRRLADSIDGEGYSVTSCKNVREALDVIAESPPHVVLADIDPQGQLDILNATKELDAAASLIFATDGASSTITNHVLSNEAFGWLAKPIRGVEVRAMVRSALRHRSLVQENTRLLETLRIAASRLDQHAGAQQLASNSPSGSTVPQGEHDQPSAAHARELAIENERRKNLEAELARSLEIRRLQARHGATEEERKQLSETLHDNVMVPLTAIGAELGLIRRKASQVSPELAEDVVDLGAKIKEIDRELKQVVWNIYPSVLVNLGLVPAIRSYMEQLASRPTQGPHPLEIELRSRGFDNGRPSEEVELGLYRAIQQGVNNVIQHAHAKRLVVDLNWTDVGLDILIADDGRGFNVHDLTGEVRPGHLDLAQLQDRIEGLQGTMDIESTESVGTTIRARIPIRSKSESNAELQVSSYRLSVGRVSDGPEIVPEVE